MKKVEVIKVKKDYPGFSINIDFYVDNGEFVSILGPSGSGKTTTLHIIAGFIRQDSGKIIKDGVDISALPPNKRNIGIVFQDYALFPYLTVFSNIAFGLNVKHIEKEQIKQTVYNLSEQLGITHILNKYPEMISGGEKQRVALARAMIVNPDVLLMDEPLSSLDAKIREKLMRDLKSFHKKFHTTIIYVTHDQSEAMYLSNQIILMNNGRIDQIGTPIELYEHPKTPFARTFIGKMNRIQINGKERYVRPEEIVIRKDGRMKGTIKEVLYLNGIVELHVEKDKENIVIRDLLRNVRHLKQGSTITFDIGGD